MGRVAAEGMAGPGAPLLGRRTCTRTSTASGPTRPTTLTEVLDNTRKYVASTTPGAAPLAEPTPLEGDAAEAVARLKEEPGEDLTVLGSGELVQSLRRRDLGRPACPPDPPAGAGVGAAAVPRRRAGGDAAAGRLGAHDHRCHHRHLPAGDRQEGASR